MLSACAHLYATAWAASRDSLSDLARVGLVTRQRPPTTELDLPEVSIGLPAPGESAGGADVTAEGAPPPVFRPHLGGAPIARPDMGRTGRGGTIEASAPAANLADVDDGPLFFRELLSRLARAQVFRRSTGSDRTSPEDWSATLRPTLLTFEAVGDGAREESRPSAPSDPAVGAFAAGGLERPRLGPGVARPAVVSLSDGERAAPFAGARWGDGVARAGRRESASSGVHDGRRADDPRPGADTREASPLLARADDASPALARGPASDTEQADQAATSLRTAFVSSSGAGGPSGFGMGGSPGPGIPASGGLFGPGSASSPLGSGRGGWGNADPSGVRTSYLRNVAARVSPLWANAFPRWAVLQGLGGSVIVSFVIAANGGISEVHVARPSGVGEFDENCRQAVLRAAPFGALPPELGPSLRWSMTFTAKNSAVLPPHGLDD